MGNIHDYTDSLVRLVSQFMTVCSVDPGISEAEYQSIRERLLRAMI